MFQLAKDDWGILLVGTLALLVSTAINVTMPYSLTFVLQKAVEPDVHWTSVAVLGGLVLAVFTAGACLTGVRVFCFSVGGERVVRRLRRKLFSLVGGQPMAFFDFMEPGEIVSRLSADCEVLRVTLTVTLVLAFRFAIQVIGGVSLLLYISWQLTLVLAAILPILGVVAALYSRKARKLGQTMQTAIANSSSLATEVLSAIRHVRAFDQEEFEVARYTARLDVTYGVARSLGIANALFLAGTELGSYIAVIGVLLYATYLLMTNSLDIEFITSFVLYSVYVAHAVGALSHQTAELSKAVGASERVFSLLDTISITQHNDLSQVSQKPTPSGPLIRGDIKFSGVSFVYPAHDHDHSSPESHTPRISNISFDLKCGEILGVVGPSGAGKSTLLSLLLRFYEPFAGSILLDNQALSSMDPSWVRRNIGFVAQDPVLFNTSILESKKPSFFSLFFSTTSQKQTNTQTFAMVFLTPRRRR